MGRTCSATWQLYIYKYFSWKIMKKTSWQLLSWPWTIPIVEPCCVYCMSDCIVWMYSTAACICMCVGLYKYPLLYSSVEAGNAPEEVTCFSDSSTSEAHSLRSFQSDSCDDNGEKHALQNPKSLTHPPNNLQKLSLLKEYSKGLTMEKFSKWF